MDLETSGKFPRGVVTPTGFWELVGWDAAMGHLGWPYTLSPLCILRFPFSTTLCFISNPEALGLQQVWVMSGQAGHGCQEDACGLPWQPPLSRGRGGAETHYRPPACGLPPGPAGPAGPASPTAPVSSM